MQLMRKEAFHQISKLRALDCKWCTAFAKSIKKPSILFYVLTMAFFATRNKERKLRSCAEFRREGFS